MLFMSNHISRRPLNRETIKYIAILTMTCNHAALALLPSASAARVVLTDIGYFTAITMCFFLAEGYFYARSVRNYAIRLLVSGLLAELPFCVVRGSFALDMMFTLLVCLGVLCICDRVPDITQKILLILLLAFLSGFCDWGVLPVLFVLLFRFSRGNRRLEAASFCVGALLQFFSELAGNWSPLVPGTTAARNALFASLPLLVSGAVILCLYSGRRAERFRTFHKWFFYFYYPAHLALLACFHLLLTRNP